MKSIKTVGLISLVLILGMLWQANRAGTFYSATSERIALSISRSSTEADLRQIARDLQDHHNIRVDFSGTTYLPNGEVFRLEMKVSTPKGEGTTAVSPVGFLFSAYGFVVDYSPDAASVFLIGAV